MSKAGDQQLWWPGQVVHTDRGNLRLGFCGYFLSSTKQATKFCQQASYSFTLVFRPVGTKETDPSTVAGKAVIHLFSLNCVGRASEMSRGWLGRAQLGTLCTHLLSNAGLNIMAEYNDLPNTEGGVSTMTGRNRLLHRLMQRRRKFMSRNYRKIIGLNL